MTLVMLVPQEIKNFSVSTRVATISQVFKNIGGKDIQMPFYIFKYSLI